MRITSNSNQIAYGRTAYLETKMSYPRMSKALLLSIAMTISPAIVADHCSGNIGASLFCDDFETGDLSHWIDVTRLGIGIPPIASPNGGFAVRLDYVAGADGAGWMWKKALRSDSPVADTQYLRWWQFWPDGFQWFSGSSGDQKLFMLDGLDPQDGWGQTADWKVYLHLVGSEHASSGVAINELYVDINYQSDGVSTWRTLGQNVSVERYQTNTWHCTEVEIVHNTPGDANGALRAWIDGTLVMDYTGVVFRDSRVSWNAIQTNGWYPNTPVNQSSFIDAVEVSVERIGCTDPSFVAPSPPTNLQVTG